MASDVTLKKVRTNIPARMDRLPWTRWHWFIIFSLGIVWLLDGLEVTIKGAVGPSLRESLGFTTVGVAGVASIYLIGAVSGALFWGYLTDKFGRQKLMIATIAVYIVGVSGTAATGAWIFGDGFEFVWFAIFRFITGFGIGGEYAAINSAIDELIPARVRGWADLAINGSYWLGAVVGSISGAIYLNIFSPDIAFRVAFGMGLILAFGILLLRFFVPESPRWQLTHGREDEAEASIAEIEEDVREDAGVDELPPVDDDEAIELRERRSIGFIELGRTLFKLYPSRSVVAFSLMLTQAFLYNAIFFTYALMLTEFFGVSNANTGWFLVPFGIGNFLGPLILGRFFDTVGRKTMIPLTFLTSAGLTVIGGLLFATGVIGQAWLMTVFWVAIFFFASAGASAGYLTASETFPLEVRAMAISFFYAFPTLIGGVIGPILFGTLITGGRWTVFYGYMVAAVLMAAGGLIHRKWGVEAAQKGLESIAMPLSVQEAQGDEEGRASIEGPAGIDIADEESIQRFQREHGIEDDGLLGPATAAVLRLQAEEDGGAAGGDLGFVDVTSPDSVRAFQQAYGLIPDGVIGPETRGAILTVRRRGFVDPADRDSIARFQRAHHLVDDGVIGRETQIAIRAVLAEQSDATETWLDVDVLDPDSVEAFQRACGITVDGIVGPETVGAIKAQRAGRRRSGEMDITDAESIRAFQRRHDLEETGVIEEPEQATLREMRERDDEGLPGGVIERTRFGVDPVDTESVRRFQREVGLDDDGVIGPETRRALRRAAHLLLYVDPTDGDSIERFQREHELHVDGVIGPETQAVLRTLEDELSGHGRQEEEEDLDEDEIEEPDLGPLMGFDPADRDKVERFQREHGLEADGRIGPATQVALRAAFSERDQEMMRRPARRPQVAPRGADRREHLRPRRRAGFSPMHMSSYVPSEDRELQRELDEIVEVLRRRGTLSRKELGQEVNARLWGPGRLREVLDVARDNDIVHRVGRDRWTLA